MIKYTKTAAYRDLLRRLAQSKTEGIRLITMAIHDASGPKVPPVVMSGPETTEVMILAPKSTPDTRHPSTGP